MTLTSKETDLLKDMKDQEELCIEKYTRYASLAKCPELSTLLNSLADIERKHLTTINSMLAGNEPAAPGALSENNALATASCTYTDAAAKKEDKFLLSDMLSTEKHVSAIYNTGVFEFKSPAARRMLSHIQAEEQQHGELIYAFMNANGMYS